MKQMRIPILIAWSIAIIGLILGSFFDLHISSMIASASNNYALTISAIGPTIGFAGVSLMGGGFIAFVIKGKYHVALKILFVILALACFGVSIYYPGGEYFGVNGFYKVAPEALGYVIAFFPAVGGMVGGYFLFKDCKSKNMWIVFVIIIVVLLIALLGVLPTIKDNMHRPRFRLISKNEAIPFHDWWKPCKDYEQLKELYKIHKDNFKSFPSGHTAEASILLVFFTFLPLANEKFEPYQPMMFSLSLLLIILVAFARILAGAHFLSDVSMGALIMLTLLFIANEIVVWIKPLHNKSSIKE